MPPKPRVTSRQIFDNTGIARDNFISGLGNANTSTLGNVLEGIDQGITLGKKIGSVVEPFTPSGQARKQAEAEIQRATVLRSQRQALQDAIKIKVDHATKDVQIEQAIYQQKRAAEAANASSKDFQTLSSIPTGDGQGILRLGQSSSLSKFDPEYAKVYRNRALQEASLTSDPELASQLRSQALDFSKDLLADQKKLAEIERIKAQTITESTKQAANEALASRRMRSESAASSPSSAKMTASEKNSIALLASKGVSPDMVSKLTRDSVGIYYDSAGNALDLEDDKTLQALYRERARQGITSQVPLREESHLQPPITEQVKQRQQSAIERLRNRSGLEPSQSAVKKQAASTTGNDQFPNSPKKAGLFELFKKRDPNASVAVIRARVEKASSL